MEAGRVRSASAAALLFSKAWRDIAGHPTGGALRQTRVARMGDQRSERKPSDVEVPPRRLSPESGTDRRLLLVCGHRKSGTTVLTNLFDSHPSLAVLPHDIKILYAYYPR